MEHSHADHRGVHNRVLGEPEETPHLGLDTATSLTSIRLLYCLHATCHGQATVWEVPEWMLFLRTPSALLGCVKTRGLWPS